MSLLKARKPGLFSRGRGGWLTIILTLLVAFSWQSLLTQTHRHYGLDTGATAATATPGAAPQEPDRKAPPSRPHDCTICREVAHAGQLVLPQAIEFEAPASADFWLAVAASPDQALTQRSHAWHSRAPPPPLQA